MIGTVSWLYRQFIPEPMPETTYRCYLCGQWHGEEYYPVVKGVPDTFNSHYLASAPSSPFLCAACAWYLDNKLEHPAFRKMSLIVREFSWFNWERSGMKEYITMAVSRGIEQNEYLVVSLSKKKHILLQAPMNAQGSKLLAIQLEEQVAYVDQSIWQIMNRSFMALAGLGHNKSEILSGQLYANTLRKHGQVQTALQHNQMLTPYRNSPQLELLSYVTIIEKEEKDESATTGDGDDPSRVAAPESRLDADRPGVQGEISHGHLAAGRKQRQGSRDDVQHAQQVRQQSLF